MPSNCTLLTTAPTRDELPSLGPAFAAFLTSFVILSGAIFGFNYVEKCAIHPDSISSSNVFAACAAWDGQWYCRIVDDGYSYNANKMSSVAFFPVYPCIASVVKNLLGCRTEFALLTVSNICTVLCAVVFRKYIDVRFPRTNYSFRSFVIVFAFSYPTTMFMRMAYTESLFLLICLTFFWALECRCGLIVLSVLAGVASGTRIVGICLLLPLVLHSWNCKTSLFRFVLNLTWSIPLSLWGLIAFVIFQWIAFEEPLAFLKAQKAWEYRAPPPFAEKVSELVLLKPIWATYIKDEVFFHWSRVSPSFSALFNMYFWNPIFWCIAIMASFYGFKVRLVRLGELLFTLGILLIPYYAQGPRGGMTSCGRYASVAFSTYVVMAHLLMQMPDECRMFAVAVLLLMSFFLSSLFVQWYWVI